MAKKKKPAKSTKTRTTKKAARSAKPAKKSPKKKATPRKAPAKSSRDAETEEPVSDETVTVDRRRKPGRRSDDTDPSQPGATSAIEKPKLERRKKVTRRRQIDPTTCERDYSDAEIEFMNALDDYKRKSGRMFPTCSEVLEVIRELGYVQLSPSELVASPPSDHFATTESLPDTTASATTGILAAVAEPAGPGLQGAGI